MHSNRLLTKYVVMEHVLVRYAELGTKTRRVRGRLQQLLRDRLSERLDADGIPYEATTVIPGRIVVETPHADTVARSLAEVPGVQSTSPALQTRPSLEAITAGTDRFRVGSTFGIDTNTAGQQDLSSQVVNEAVGAYVEANHGAAVDLDNPETWIEIDVREPDAYLFTARYEGPGGFPVGTQEPLAALISGGIDSPVAAYEAMTRGADIVPVYAYNQPYVAEDHVARFEETLRTLSRFHPAKDWCYYRIDMEPVNRRLEEIDAGRMILHRIIMFRVTAKVAKEEGLHGIVTGESIGQKSSQTTINLSHTSRAVSLPIHRPLLTWPKDEITEMAREIGTYDWAIVDSACQSIAPPHPTPSLKPHELDRLRDRIDLDGLVDIARDRVDRVDLAATVESSL